jgi:hypothetical protein
MISCIGGKNVYAPSATLFWSKTQCVPQQNKIRFAPKRTSPCSENTLLMQQKLDVFKAKIWNLLGEKYLIVLFYRFVVISLK